MLAICPNPTIDRQVFVSALNPGSVSRAHRNQAWAGGKPVDAIRAMQAHAVNPPMLVLLPQENPDYVGLLKNEGIKALPVTVPGTMRETIALYEDTGRATIINGQGAEVSPADWTAFCDAARTHARGQDWVIISGSFPPGVSGEQVIELIEAARHDGAKIALDTGSSWLQAALPAHPDLITPNLSEATLALGGEQTIESVEVDPEDITRAVAAAEALVQQGVAYAVVTAGAAGTAWATADASGSVPIAKVDVVSPIGAGDAFIGGLMARYAAGADFGDAVRWGVATAASAITQWVPGRAHARQVDDLYASLGTR